MTKLYLYARRYLTVLLLISSFVAWSQTKTVTGKVTSADDGTPIPGVNILIKGTGTGTASDAEGNFSISASDNDVLVFSFVGYASQEVTVGSQTNISVSMQVDVTALSEVVVIGYGTVNRRDATGAIATVKAEDFNQGIISSPEQLIQGRTAGVQITSSSGEPGAGVSLRIRGTSSVRGGNNPLFVVDGIPLSGDNISAGGSDFGRGGQSPKNPLNFINPSDIESIDILKDASATAIYGSRGANGVVIITTKSGKGKKNNVEYSGNVSISQQAKTFDVLGADAFLDAYSDLGGNASIVDFGADTDWQDEVNRTAVSQSHNIAYSTSFKNSSLRASVSYDNQEGIIKNSEMTRYTGRFNFNQSLANNKLKIGIQSLFSHVDDEAAPITTSAGFEGDILASSIFYNPTIPNTPTNYDESTPDPSDQYPGDAANPNSLLKFYKDVTGTDRNLINVSAGYDILPSLNFKVNTGWDRASSLRTSAMSGLQTKIGNVNGNGRAFLTDQSNQSSLLETFLTYQKNIGGNSLTVLVGYSYQKFENYGINANAANFGTTTNVDDMMEQLVLGDDAARDAINTQWQAYEYEQGNRMRVYDLFSTPPQVIEYLASAGGLPRIGPRGITGNKFSSTDELQSFFGRANYNIGERFFITASVRADGSTKFGGNNQYGIFPSGAVKWRLTEESFMPEFFDELAVRLGYGITGNQEIGHNLYTNRQRYNNPGLQNNGALNATQGLVNVAFANPDLQWEETSQINFGVDYAFFNSRLNGSLDFYRKNTTKLLMQTNSAAPAPTDFVWENLDADVINSGIELTINGVVVDQSDLDVNISFNIAYNDNIVKNLGAVSLPTGRIHGQGLTGAYAQRISDNQPLFAYFVRPFTGYGADGLNKPEEDFQTFVGKSAIPKVNSGTSISARYKNFDASIYFNGQFGHYIYNNIANAMFTKGSIANARNVIPEVLTTDESPANAPDVSERFLEKGNFWRLQNLTFGYNVTVAKKSLLIDKLRVYVTGQNLFILTDYSGLDPEVNVDKNIDGVPSLGIDYTSYPRARTWTFGVTATF